MKARLLLCACTALWAAPAFAQSSEGGLEEIIVTAQKREQNLQDVPVSVTALAGNTLQANRIADVRDLNAVAPNLTVRVAAGGTSQANYSMRGLVTAGGALGSDKGVSVYIDGVYLQSSKSSLFQLADIERIEVLKGPQGTLFGRNSTGGAISITTRKPSGEFKLHQELTYGNYEQFRTKTRLDLPKVGPISVSLTYVHSEREGDTKNLGAGTVWDYTASGRGFRRSVDRLGDENTESFYAAASFDLLDNLDLDYRFDWTKSSATPEAQGVAYIDGAGLNAILAGQPNQNLMTPVTGRRPKAINNWFTTPNSSYNRGHNLTAQYRVSDSVSVKNILSYRRSGVSSTYQLDGLGGLVVTPTLVGMGLAPAALLGQPWSLLSNNGYQRERQWSDEFQLNYKNDWVDLTAGYIHFDYHVVGGGFESVPNTISFRPLPNFVIPGADYQLTTVNLKSDAFYAQVEGHLTSSLDIVGGYRWTHDKKDGIDNSVQDGAGASLPTTIAYKNSRSTYLAGINFRPTEGVLTYAKYTTGFISGGNLAGVSYEPETAKSYEVGVKADLFDRRVRSNLALFDVKYGNLQFQTSGLNVLPPINASAVLVNAGSGKAKGFEWENTFLPLDGLTLTGNVGYTDFKYTRIDPIIGNIATFIPVNRPKWTFTGSAEYVIDDVYAGGHLLFRADLNYRGKTPLGYSKAGHQDAVDATTTKAAWIVNGRVALVDFDLGGTKAQAALWGRNLFNNRYLSNVTPITLGALGTFYPGSYERARTFGVDLMFDF